MLFTHLTTGLLGNIKGRINNIIIEKITNNIANHVVSFSLFMYNTPKIRML